MIAKALRAQGYAVKFDNRETHKPGFKFAEWELKGVPVRIAIGPRDLESKTVEVARRDTKEKQVMKMDAVATEIPVLLNSIQDNIYQKALKFRNEKTTQVNSYDEFKKVLDEKEDLLKLTGMEQSKLRLPLKKKQKPLSDAFHWMSKRRQATCIYSGSRLQEE